MQREHQLSKQQISFVIARERPDGGLASYSFGGEVKFDTLKSAKEYCRYANDQAKKDKEKDMIYPFDDYSEFHIYGLVKIDL